MNDAERSLTEFGRAVRRKGLRLRGLLGDMTGTIAVPGRSGWYYVRTRQAGSGRYSVGEFPGNVRPLYNLPVIIEEDPISGGQYITGIDETTLQYGIDNGNATPPATELQTHAATHAWGGDDQLSWIHTLQIFPLRVQPGTTAKHITVQGGAYYIDGQYCWKTSPSDVDLTTYWPSSGVVYVLIYIDAAAAVSVSAAVGSLNALSAPPPETYGLAAVLLRATATTVAWTDIADIRFTDGATAGNRTYEVLQMLGRMENELDIEMTRHEVEG